LSATATIHLIRDPYRQLEGHKAFLQTNPVKPVVWNDKDLTYEEATMRDHSSDFMSSGVELPQSSRGLKPGNL
jgi:hypothetical protein